MSAGPCSPAAAGAPWADRCRDSGSDAVTFQERSRAFGGAHGDGLALGEGCRPAEARRRVDELVGGGQVDESTTISHDLLSNSQKRLLSFLYYVAANPDIVIADELANGMHHDWVQTCVDEISDRQSFLASQDPLLFDLLTFDSQEVVKQSFILCGLERRDGRGTFTWKNLDDAAASSFYRAYEAGIQHVSEILRTKGLW